MSSSNAAVRIPTSERSEGAFTKTSALRDFDRIQLDIAGVLPLAERILSGATLSLHEALSLSSLAFPILAKLAELSAGAARDQIVASPILRPLALLPLATLLERENAAQVTALAEEHIAGVLNKVSISAPLAVTVDRWTGTCGTDAIVGCIKNVLASPVLARRITVVGPSTAELHELASVSSKDSRAMLLSLQNEILPSFLDAGITSIEGGDDLSVLLLAASLGFEIAVGQQILPPHYEDGGAVVEAKRCEERFICELYSLREQLTPTGKFAVWFPLSSAILDGPQRKKRKSPLGLQILRTIAIARLVLDKVARIRAPYSLLGEKVSHVALAFGANDLGYAAVDADTAASLGLATLSEGLNTTNSHRHLPIVSA